MVILLMGLGGKTGMNLFILAQHFLEKKDPLPQKLSGFLGRSMIMHRLGPGPLNI
jgi:hypothetical protein